MYSYSRFNTILLFSVIILNEKFGISYLSPWNPNHISKYCPLKNFQNSVRNSVVCLSKNGPSGSDFDEVTEGNVDSQNFLSSSIYVAPPPFNDIVDVNLEHNAIVYECVLGRDLGFEIVQEGDFAVVDQVLNYNSNL